MSNGQLPPVTNGAIPAPVVQQFLSSSGMTIEQLMLALIPLAQKYAIPSISNFFVGTVALGSSGSIYFGANYEFPGQALSFTVHGEQAATAHAISCGESGMQMLAVSAAPCGYCRQFLYELTSDSPAEYARHFSNIAYPQRVRARRPGRYCGVDVSAIPWYDAFTNNSRSSGEGGVGGSQLLLRALYIDKGSNHRRYGCAATLSFWQH